MKKIKFHLVRYPSNEKATPILTPREDIEWEAKAVFNCCVVREGNIFRMLYRTYPRKLEKKTQRLWPP